MSAVRGCANYLLLLLVVVGWFWIWGFAWGMGMAAVFGLLAYVDRDDEPGSGS